MTFSEFVSKCALDPWWNGYVAGLIVSPIFSAISDAIRGKKALR
jgi:hypothetical protein